MTVESFVVLTGDSSAALQTLVERVRSGVEAAGWVSRVSFPFIHVFTPAGSRLEVTGGLDGHGVLVGEMFDREGAPLDESARSVMGCRALNSERAEAVVSEVWGRYVLVRRTDGEAAVLRDPSGALEAVGWRKDGVTVITSHPEGALDSILPDDLAIDWSVVARLAARAGQFSHRLALSGLTPIAAGELRTFGIETSRAMQIWRPSDIYRSAERGARPDLRGAVQKAVRGLAGAKTWVAEVSGGLDSAIVAFALLPEQRSRVRAWVNHYVDQPEGDERPYARPVVESLGYELCEVRRDALGISIDRLMASADGFRPATNDIDPDYNDDIAMRIATTDAWGSLTGQGGDAVFYQMPSPLIALDEVLERRLGARLSVIHRIARWTRRSLWPFGWPALSRRQRRASADMDHPWLDDLKGVPPAKALQISSLASCQAFQAQAIRSRGGACINPLLSQPVLEAGLAWSAVDLTWGGRDRAAVREAFRDVLPEVIFSRRSKGELGAYYGEAVVDRLDVLRPFILEGVLAEAGVLPPGLDKVMTRETLIWRGGFSTILSLALTEAWARHWTMRLERRQA